jgi:uncharacterized membrane protein HdeD (DUF308 family)
MMLLRNPLSGSLVVTLVLASYFVVAGIFRIVAALSIELPGSGWTLVDGLITLYWEYWSQWPTSGLWVYWFIRWH